MKIGFVCPSSPEPVGGVIVLYEVANALARRGHMVHIAHAYPWGQPITGLDDLPWFTFEESIVHQFPAASPAPEPDPFVPEVTFGTGGAGSVGNGLHAGLVQGFDMLGPEIETDWYRQPGLKVCVASWLIDAAGYLGTPAEQCVTMPPGIPLETFRLRNPIRTRPPAVAMLAHKHPAKGTSLGLKTLERVHAARPDARIVLFSAHGLERKVPSWAEHFLLPDHRELSTLFNQCSVFLQTSAYEGFGLTAVEAMASGCALVTTDNGGSRDYAFDGLTAVVTDRGDTDALVAATIHLLDDAEARASLAEEGHRFVQRFTWDESARVLEAHLEAYLADPEPFTSPPGPNRLAGVRAEGNWAATVLRSTPDLRKHGAEGSPPPIMLTASSRPAPLQMAEPNAPAPPGPRVPAEDAAVFNMVWTGRTFDDLQLFTRSMMAHSGARFRFVANACPAEQIDLMEAFAAEHPDRIVGVDVVSTDRMVRHGDALDEVLRRHDDGELFSFVDPDILARAPFLGTFLTELTSTDAVTSGREVWSQHNTRPAEHPGVNGEYFYDQDGFVFGSPHFAVYRRSAVDEVRDRWGVGFSSDGNETAEVRGRLEQMGRSYMVYDTAKIMNILMQGDGHRLVHRESPHLVHIGGMSHYLAPPLPVPGPDGTIVPEWGQTADWRNWDGMADRYDIAQYAALALRAVASGGQPPAPETVEPHLKSRAITVHEALVELTSLLGLDDSALAEK